MIRVGFRSCANAVDTRIIVSWTEQTEAKAKLQKSEPCVSRRVRSVHVRKSCQSVPPLLSLNGQREALIGGVSDNVDESTVG